MNGKIYIYSLILIIHSQLLTVEWIPQTIVVFHVLYYYVFFHIFYNFHSFSDFSKLYLRLQFVPFVHVQILQIRLLQFSSFFLFFFPRVWDFCLFICMEKSAHSFIWRILPIHLYGECCPFICMVKSCPFICMEKSSNKITFIVQF